MHEGVSLKTVIFVARVMKRDREASPELLPSPEWFLPVTFVAVDNVMENSSPLSRRKVIRFESNHCVVVGLAGDRICRVEEFLKRHLTGLRECTPSGPGDWIHDAVWAEVHVHVYALLMVWIIYGREGKAISHHL